MDKPAVILGVIANATCCASVGIPVNGAMTVSLFVVCCLLLLRVSACCVCGFVLIS
jgi:hypothetical protein